MDMVSKDAFFAQQEHFFSLLREGALCILPTDTIYGLVCDASNEAAVEALRTLKQRPTKPLAVLVPNKQWIKEHCEVGEKDLDYLPGAYTLIVRLKESLFPPNVCGNTVGIRIPDHWIKDEVEQYGKPLVATSVNLQDEPHIARLADVSQAFQQQIAFGVEDGEKSGHASTIINTLTREAIER